MYCDYVCIETHKLTVFICYLMESGIEKTSKISRINRKSQCTAIKISMRKNWIGAKQEGYCNKSNERCPKQKWLI